MKKIYLLILAFGFFSLANAQTTLFSDNFESGSGNWTLNTPTAPGGTSTINGWLLNGDFTIPSFFGSTPLASQPVGIMPANSNYLHIAATGFAYTGASYFAASGDKPFTVMSSGVSTVGYTGVSFSFWWLSSGGQDNVYYSIDGGTTWLVANATNYNNGAAWALETITNAAFDNQADLRFGFFFDDIPAPQVDPPFCVDDVKITGMPAAPPSTMWTGAALDHDWTNAANWTAGVPTACSQDAIIPVALGASYPNLVGQTVGCKNLTLNAGATLTVDFGSEIQVCGNILSAGSFSGMGKLTIDGTTNQTLTGIVTMGTVELNKLGATDQFEIMGSSVLNVTDHLDMIDGELKATAGNVVIASTLLGTAYIDDFSPAYTGTFFAGSNVAVQRYFSNPGTAFHYITSPVTGFNIAGYSLPATSPNGTQVTPNATCTGLATGSAYGQMFDYRENTVTTCNLEGWHVRTTGVVNTGEGFAAIIPDTTTLFAQGDPTTGNVSTTNVTYSGAGMLLGWNLIGNPYPSAINWASVVASNLHIVGGTAHLYESTGFYDGTYQAANLIMGGNIAHGQAFFVQVNAATQVSFTNAMRTTGDPGFKSQEDQFEYLISLKLSGANGADKTTIAFDENFTTAKDYGYDADKRKSTTGKPTFYTNDWNTKQGINAIPTLENDIVVMPLGLDQGVDGQFTISVEDLINIPERVLMFLEDKETGTFTNLRVNNSYTFDVTATTMQERFNLHFVPAFKIEATNESCEGNDGSITFLPNNFSINGNPIVWDNTVTDINTSQVVTDLNHLEGSNYFLSMTYDNYTVEEIYVIGSAEKVIADFDVSSDEVFVGDLIQLTNNTIGNATYSWNFGNGEVLNNVLNPSYAYTEAGTYDITLESITADCNDSKVLSVEVLNKTTAIKEINKELINVYTNNKTLFVDLQSITDNQETKISVYNMIGKLIATKTVNSNIKTSINLDNNTKGYYLVKIQRQSAVSTFKVLIK